MSKIIYWITVSLISLLLIMKAGIVLSQDADSAEPQSIHQRAAVCWDDFKSTFLDEPVECQEVCDSCHSYATVIPDQSGNPQAVTTDEIYPEAPDNTVNWNTIGLLQQSCRDCHFKEIDPATNHAIFVEHEVHLLGEFEGNRVETV